MKDTDQSHETHISKGELLNKRIILYSLAGISWVFAFTVATLALRQLPIPDSLDRLVTYLIGVLSGVLVKTGLDQRIGSDGAPVAVTNAGNEPLQVEAVDEVPNATQTPGEDEPAASETFGTPLSKAVVKGRKEPI